MAMIYDLVTGTVTSDDEYTGRMMPRESTPAPEAGLQTIDTGTAIEDMTPVDAYMVMLQDILKKS
ncbi:MAG TPA: hypothetical protein VLB10_04680 [Gammaproteobacteria bacterium]|jgi:hypothetical protein|nr:hypothetical protein [Gammaproteobacteria bacterium]